MIPTPIPSPLPTVDLRLDTIITATGQLASDQAAAWTLSAPQAPLFIGLAAVIFVFWVLYFVKAWTQWATQVD